MLFHNALGFGPGTGGDEFPQDTTQVAGFGEDTDHLP